eukprot:375798_1
MRGTTKLTNAAALKLCSLFLSFVSILALFKFHFYSSNVQMYNYVPQKQTLETRYINVTNSQTENDPDISLSFECIANNNESTNIFNNIFDNNIWRDAESRSGLGSELKVAIDTILYLKTFFIDHKVESFADIPCGDVNWQFASKELNTIKFYFGGDISSSLIKSNQILFKSHKNKIFRTWDLVNCQIPQFYYNNDLYNFDFVLTRDVIQHLPLNDGLKFVRNVVMSNISYWGVTSYPSNINNNIDIQTAGGMYRNNLEMYPFNLSSENVNILFREKSHKFIQVENDFFFIYKIDDKIKSFVTNHFKF